VIDPEVDHILPRHRGGSDDVANLRVVCRHDNRARQSRVDWTPPDRPRTVVSIETRRRPPRPPLVA
jgi:5-methylcytosine-specific restriction endonuclease McrA